jgi:hypothetical protein
MAGIFEIYTKTHFQRLIGLMIILAIVLAPMGTIGSWKSSCNVKS